MVEDTTFKAKGNKIFRSKDTLDEDNTVQSKPRTDKVNKCRINVVADVAVATGTALQEARRLVLQNYIIFLLFSLGISFFSKWFYMTYCIAHALFSRNRVTIFLNFCTVFS